MRTAVARPMPRLYVHDVRGFIWAAFSAIVLIDLPLTAGSEHRAPAIIASILTCVCVALFIFAYGKFGSACQKAQVTVNLGKQEAIEFCLAALGQLQACTVTRLDQTEGEIHAIATEGDVAHDVQFQVLNVLEDNTWQICISCRPQDPWTLIDLNGRNRQIVYALQYFLHGFHGWDYKCSMDGAIIPFAVTPNRKARTRFMLSFACIAMFLVFSIPEIGRYAAFRIGNLMYGWGNYNLAQEMMISASALDVTAQQANLVRARCALANGDQAAGLRALSTNISSASDELAQNLLIQGDIWFRARNFVQASKSYARAAAIATDSRLIAYAQQQKLLASHHGLIAPVVVKHGLPASLRKRISI